MVPATRWLVVALLALGVAAPPVLLRVLPASDSHVGAVALVRRVERAANLPWSGEVRATGSLHVPANGSVFGGVARLLGETTALRAWWRDPRHWRIDRMRNTGETDRVRDGGQSIVWSYEESQVSIAPYSRVRLPDDSDVLPTTLGARLVSGAQPNELSRLPARRIAGRSADGLRLVTHDVRSTITRVDLWADGSTGLPLRVDLYDAGGSLPLLTTRFVTVNLDRPSVEQTGFRITPGVRLARTHEFDAIAASNAFDHFDFPEVVAGLRRNGPPGDLGAIASYGRGPTSFLVIPLRASVAVDLAAQLRTSNRSRDLGYAIGLQVGPLTVLLVERTRGYFLFVGTLRPGALLDTALALVDGLVTVLPGSVP